MADITEALEKIKKREQIIEEIQDKIRQIKTRDRHTYYGNNLVLADGVAQEIVKHFRDELGYPYVKVEPCGCGNKTYDVIIQW